jgi:hypothetical protein
LHFDLAWLRLFYLLLPLLLQLNLLPALCLLGLLH